MTYAIIISLVIHLAIFAYMMIGEKRPSQNAYPKIMNVDLVSMPPISKGTSTGSKTPGQTQAEAVKPKAQTKVEPKPTTAHLAEVEKKKRQNRKKKPKPKSQTKAEKADNEKSNNKASQPGDAPERIGLPEGVETGSEFGGIRLDGASFETPTYINILFAKIKNRWYNPFQGTDKTAAVIYFTILRNGHIIDPIVEHSSGAPSFDQSALRAVIESKPPPLPLEYTGNQLGIHLEFQYVP